MSRRAVAPKELLKQHFAVPLFANPKNDDSDVTGFDFHPSSDASKDQTSKPVGLNIHGWNIVTSNSPIATQDQEKEFATFLSTKCHNTKKVPPPELLFYKAFVLISRQSDDQVADPIKMESNQQALGTDFTMGKLKITAREALGEWAEAHQHFSEDDANLSSYRGVSVLKTSHASLWERKRGESKEQKNKTEFTTKNDSSNSVEEAAFDGISHIAVTRSELYYDWTFSTPYSCDSCIPNSIKWDAWEESGIKKNMHLLIDRTQPILLFDEVVLFEDDLHDNGQVKLSVKVRVMPTCFFLLQRLFLRVDNVIVRCRDTRIFCRFQEEEPKQSGPNSLYRDVEWRECSWSDLERRALPSDARAWTEPHINSLIPHLPVVELPADIPQFSIHSCQSKPG